MNPKKVQKDGCVTPLLCIQLDTPHQHPHQWHPDHTPPGPEACWGPQAIPPKTTVTTGSSLAVWWFYSCSEVLTSLSS